MEKKRALITGITGQDGSYLAEHLLSLGYEVWGMVRRTSLDPLMRIENMVLAKEIQIRYGNLRDSDSLRRVIAEAKPDEIYNLAAQSDVGISFSCPDETEEINYYGLGRLVHEAVAANPMVRIYQASTSEMFGRTSPPQNEESIFAPVSPYGEAKLRAHEDFVKGYRQRHGLFIASGILFNHESPRRGRHFVTRKITASLAKIRLGLQESMTLGNLDATRDWGFAGDYVKAMHLILTQNTADDYVIATGESHTVREFFESAANKVGLPITWEGNGLNEVAKDPSGRVILTIDEKYYRPVEVDALRGDSSKALKNLGWAPTTSFDDLVTMMVEADLVEQKRFAS